jgi:hypothetical protein
LEKTKLHFDSILSMSNVAIMLSVLGQSRLFLVAHTPKKKKKKKKKPRERPNIKKKG